MLLLKQLVDMADVGALDQNKSTWRSELQSVRQQVQDYLLDTLLVTANYVAVLREVYHLERQLDSTELGLHHLDADYLIYSFL